MGLGKGWVLVLNPVREETDAGFINAEVTLNVNALLLKCIRHVIRDSVP